MESYKMLRLSEKLHRKIIRQAVPDVTDEEVYRVIRYWPSANPFYYPEWFDDIWSKTSHRDRKEMNKEYESSVIEAIECVDPIRAAVIFQLGIFGDYSDNFLNQKISECIDKHRHLVMRMEDQ